MAGAGRELTGVERRLVDAVLRGGLLDLGDGEEDVTEAQMRSWGPSRTVRADVVRDIVLGRLAPDPDPRGLRLCGARIDGRLDLENATSTVSIELYGCLLEQGLNARDAHLFGLVLSRCRIEHPADPPIDANRLTATAGVVLTRAVVSGHCAAAAVRLAGGRVGGQLDCAGAVLRNESGPALEADGLQVDQDVFLRARFEAVGSGGAGAVRLVGGRIGGRLDCSGAVLRNESGPVLHADGLQVDQSMLLGEGFEAVGSGGVGAVRLFGARIGGQLICSGVLRNESGPALLAHGLKVDRDMGLMTGFEAVGSGGAGAVRLSGARIGGTLDCVGAVLRNESGPALHAGGLQVDQDVFLREGLEMVGAGGAGVVLDLSGARVGGVLVLSPARWGHRQDPRRRLGVDGLTYTGLPRGSAGENWLGLLRDATPEYAAQPYQQLAAGHRAAGHDAAARRVLIAQRRDQLDRHALTGRAERTWAKVTGVTLGYGYQPWRALLVLLAIIAASIGLALGVGGHAGGLATRPPAAAGTPAVPEPASSRPCSAVDQIGAGLDLGLPLVKIAARDRCQPTPTGPGQTLTVASWILQILAWTFATLFIAGFTNAVRKT